MTRNTAVRGAALTALALLALAAPQPAAAQAAPGVDAFAGDWAYQPDRSDDIERAIERGIDDMNFITKRIARGRLRSTNEPYRTIAIAAPDGRVSTSYDGRAAIVSPADGTPIRWRREDGEMLDVATLMEEGTLVQTFVAEDGSRENRFRLNDDGTLDLIVTIRSERLPAPIVYRLGYRRP